MKALGIVVELAPFLVVAFGFTYLIRAILNADRRERTLLDARDRLAHTPPPPGAIPPGEPDPVEATTVEAVKDASA